MLTPHSAFWGQSFVAELTRISAHGEKKLKLRRASLARTPSAPALAKPETNGDARQNGNMGISDVQDGTDAQKT